MKKKLLTFAIVAVAIMVPVFSATTVEASGQTLDLSFVQNAVNLIVGIFAGGYCILKAALDIFHAVRNASEDQNAIKKAIGGFVLNAAILGGFMFVINFVFGRMSTASSGTLTMGENSSDVSSNFFGTLSGALVDL